MRRAYYGLEPTPHDIYYAASDYDAAPRAISAYFREAGRLYD